MARNVICKSKGTAIQIIKAIAENMNDGMQKDALQSVAEWVQKTVFDIPEDTDKRRALALKLGTNIRNSRRSRMSNAERRAEAAFFLEGIEAEARKRKSKGLSDDI